MFKQLFYILIIIPLIFSSQIINQNYWTNCGNDTDHLQKIDIEYEPHVHCGEDLKLTLSGILDKQITSGEIDYSIFFHRFPFFKGNFELCSKLQCPLKKGNMNFNTSFQIPKKFPHGKFKIQAVGNDQDNQELFCVEINFIIDKKLNPK